MNATTTRFRVSDRLLARAGRGLQRLLAAHPHLAGSLLAHAVLAALLWSLPGWGDAQRAKSAARAAAADAQRIARTELRELQRRLQRIDEIRRLLDPAAAAAPPWAASAPADLSPAGQAAQLQALTAQAAAWTADIEAAQRRWRAAELARLTGRPQSAAARQLAADAARAAGAAASAAAAVGPPALAASATASTAASAAAAIAQLEQRARDSLAVRQARLAAQRDGVAVTPAPPPAAATAAASAPGPAASIALVGDIPRSMAEQTVAILRLGGPQGRVGVAGVEGGRSLHVQGIRGVAGGRAARADEEPDRQAMRATEAARRMAAQLASWQQAPAVEQRGGNLDLTLENGDRAAEHGGGTAEARAEAHTARVPYLRPPPMDSARLRAGGGRTIGAGGVLLNRIYLDHWYLIGPFDGPGARALDTVYPPEQHVDLDGSYRGQGGQPLAWRYTSRGFYPFVLPDAAERAVYYAYTELRIDDDRDLWLAIAADDDSKLWLDGRLVWTSERRDKPWYHPPYYLRDEQVASLGLVEGHRRVHLTRGTHRLLFKLYNDRDHAFFSVVLAPTPP